jgi:hypothetical protein
MGEKNSNSWASDIDRAMREIDDRKISTVLNASYITIPPGFLYIGVLVLFIVLVMNWSAIIRPHKSSGDRNYVTAPRVSLLMIAEDIENYRKNNKNLPDKIPGALGQILNMKYEKLNNNKFTLELVLDDTTLQLIDDNKSISFKSI